MSVSSGNDGAVYIGANPVAEVRSYTVRENAPRIDRTVLGDANRRYMSDVPDVEGTIECLFEPDDTTGQEAMTVGAVVSLDLRPQGTGTGLPTWTVSATILSIDGPNPAFGEMLTRSFSWAAAGALTKGVQA